MKTEDWIWVAQADRRNGKTTTMAAAAKLLKATLVCMSAAEANRVSREHDCSTMAVSEPVERLRGRRPLGPFLFDPSAVMQICVEARMEIAAREETIKATERKVAVLGSTVDRLEAELANGRERIQALRWELNEIKCSRRAERDEQEEEVVELLARLVAKPGDADAIRAAKDLLPAEKGGYR